MSAPDTPFYPMTHDDALLILAALQALNPGPAGSDNSGFMGPAAYLSNGLILKATELIDGLLSKEDKLLLNNPDRLVFYANAVTGTAGFHNSIYRGKNLGTSVTAAQYAAISAGTFDDMFIGDYWVINGVTWRIAGFDYWLHCGDTECTTHHVVIVPDTNLATCKMNNTNITTGAYIGSDYYTGANSNTGKATAQSAINGAFTSAHILTHREYLTNATANGRPSAGGWYDSTFELMNERMVYGNAPFSPVSDGSNVPANYTIDNAQLPLFRLDHSRICNRASWWLRGVVSATLFASVGNDGRANYFNASNSFGVRPAFGIKA